MRHRKFINDEIGWYLSGSGLVCVVRSAPDPVQNRTGSATLGRMILIIYELFGLMQVTAISVTISILSYSLEPVAGARAFSENALVGTYRYRGIKIGTSCLTLTHTVPYQFTRRRPSCY
jgi:hypothetical protein